MGHRVLRKRLEEMTHVDDVSRHPALLAALTRECPNTVTLVNSVHSIKRYTCLMHVFDFDEKSDYAAIPATDVKIGAANRDSHYLSQTEIASAKRISRHLSESGRSAPHSKRQSLRGLLKSASRE